MFRFFMFQMLFRHYVLIFYGLIFCHLFFSTPGGTAEVSQKPATMSTNNHSTQSISTAGQLAQSQVISLTLSRAIALAMQLNRNITTSSRGLESQKLSVVSAWSNFDYKIVPGASLGLAGGNSGTGNDYNLGLAVQKKFVAGTQISVGPTVGKVGDSYRTNMGIAIQQPLLRGFGQDVNIDSVYTAEYGVKTSGRSLYQTKVNTVLETVSAFLDAVRQKKTADSYEAMGKRLRSHAEVARAKERVGLATPMDSYRAEIRLKDAESSMIQARESLRDIIDRLKIILTLPMETEIDIQEPYTLDPFTMTLINAIETAMAKRIEIEQALADLKEQERKSLLLKHNILPELNLVLTYDQYGMSDQIGQSSRFDQNFVELRFQSTTDLARTTERIAYQQSLIQLQSLRVNLSASKDDIQRQVRKQWLALSESIKRIGLRQDQIHQAEGKLELAQVKFSHSMADNFDVIEAETELQRARIDLLSAEVEYAIGLYQIQSAMGTLVPRS
jgi:outer membrane protein